MSDLNVSGAAAGQPVSDAATISPFAGVSVTSTAAATPETTATVTLSTTADGALSHLGVGALSADGSTYTVSGSPALVQAALRGLVFTPTLHQVAVGQSVTTGFGLTVSDASGSVASTATSVVATAADIAPTITDTSAAHAPTASKPLDADNSAPGATSFTPFAYASVADPDAGASETTAITLAQNGAATDAVGTLFGAGLTKTGVGTYTLAAASPAAESAALQALRFTPAGLPSSGAYAGASLDVTLSVSDGSAAPVAATSTLQLVPNPALGSPAIDSFSQSTTTTYNDTTAPQTSPTYSTTVEAVLDGKTILYDETFALPASDPQVQAAEAQAQAALRNAGATAGAPTQSASNVETLSSQTSTTETGRTSQSLVQVTTSFGRDFEGPNVTNAFSTGVANPVSSSSAPGYLFLAPGQLDVNTNDETDITVSRTVTTTSTTLLSQKYVVSGSTSAAMPTATTTLVSSNAQGVEGDSTSGGAGADGRPVFTADGSQVLFSSDADNLVTPDALGANGYPTYDLYLKTLSTGAVTRVDVTATGVQANADVFSGSISGDGRSAVFGTAATNLDLRATDGSQHVYEKSLVTGALTLIAPADYVIRNAQTGAVETLAANVSLYAPAVSADGRYVAASASTSGGSNGELVVFDTLTHTAVDVTGPASAFVGSQTFAAGGGTRLVFATSAHLTAADAARGANTYGVYTYDAGTGAVALASATASGTTANGTSYRASISADGTKVAFATFATNLSATDLDTTPDVYVKNLSTGALTLVDTTVIGVKADGSSYDPSISADGTVVSFTSTATNLDARAGDGAFHIYTKNLSTGALTLIDTAPDGAVGNYNAQESAVSPDGTKVAFVSTESNLVPNYVDGHGSNVFLAAPATATTPPAITGLPATESDPGGPAYMPFTTVVLTDPQASATYSVGLISDPIGGSAADGVAGTFSGPGITGASGTPEITASSIAELQAELRQVTFTPGRNLVTGAPFTGAHIYVSLIDAGLTFTAQAETTVSFAGSGSINTPPAIGGTVANQPAADNATVRPFSTVTVTDPDAGQTETVTVTYAAANGTLAGSGFTGQAGSYSESFASAAAAQAALQALVFTPTANQAAPGSTVTTGFTLAVGDGTATTTNTGASVAAASVNDPPVLGGTQAGQADTAGTAVHPFSGVTIADPDTGQGETVTVSFTAGAGTLSGGGFTQTATPGVYTVTAPAGAAGASAAAVQADLRAAVFTPTAGQSATTTFTVSVTDGQATATDSTTTVAATYTAPPSGGGGGASSGPGFPQPAADPLPVEFQNLERALLTGVDALTPGTAVYAAAQAFQLLDSQYVHGQVGLAQAEAALVQSVTGTTAVAVADYAFFTGFTPTAQGLDYLVHSSANATDLNDPYYARFSTENRYINFAVNLATGSGAGAATFQAGYGALSLADATAKAYAAVFGAPADAAKVSALLNTLVPDGLGGQETRATYFAQYGGDGPSGQGTKAAMVGWLLAEAVETGSGVYGAATAHYLAALAHGTAPAMGSELALTYGAPVNLVGVTPAPDPAVTG